MNLRELIDQLLTIHLTQEDIPVLSEDGWVLYSVEFDNDEGPCVLLLFKEDLDA